MRKPTILIPLCLILGCSGDGSPSVSEAPHPSSPVEAADNSPSYIIRKKDGLEVEILIEGDARPVKSGDWVTVHWRGKVVEDEHVFGDTFKKGVPFSIYLRPGKVIKGWERGLVGLRVGTRAILRIPALLAYGEMGLESSQIPPNADLHYEIEILDTATRPNSK